MIVRVTLNSLRRYKVVRLFFYLGTVKQTFSETGDGVNPFIFPGYIKETTSERKDSRSVSACAFCGKPGTTELVLKTCGGCRQLLYCSKEHQKVSVSFRIPWGVDLQ